MPAWEYWLGTFLLACGIVLIPMAPVLIGIFCGWLFDRHR